MSSNAVVELRDATRDSLATTVPLPPEEVQLLVGTEVLSAVAFKAGQLRIVFSPGYHLVLRPAGDSVTQFRQTDVFECASSEGFSQYVAMHPGG